MPLGLIEAGFLGTVFEGLFYGNLCYEYDLPGASIYFIFRNLLRRICPVPPDSSIEEIRPQKYSHLSHVIALRSVHCFLRP